MSHQRRTFAAWPITAAMLVAIVVWLSGCTSPSDDTVGDTVVSETVMIDTVIIDLRVWQDPNQPTALWLSAQVSGHDEESLDKVPLANDRLSRTTIVVSRHWYTEVDIGGVGVRIFQQQLNPQRILVSACASACRSLSTTDRLEVVPFRPLGKTLLPLDHGADQATRMRYGDLRITVPRGNPELLRDREHLLALRDVFDARPPLNWSVGTPTAMWEGVTLSGAPPRVTGLDLSQRNLTGEIWGYLGDLVELTELRLDRNELGGTVPTKMQLLKQLAMLRLGGNQLAGCAPPGLWSVKQHDLADTALEQCPNLKQPGQRLGSSEIFVAGIARSDNGLDDYLFLVVDVPRAWVDVGIWGPAAAVFCELDEEPADIFGYTGCSFATGVALRSLGDYSAYVFWDWDTGRESERGHYTGCIYDCREQYSPAAWVEKLAASKWVTVATRDPQTHQTDWVWP